MNHRFHVSRTSDPHDGLSSVAIAWRHSGTARYRVAIGICKPEVYQYSAPEWQCCAHIIAFEIVQKFGNKTCCHEHIVRSSVGHVFPYSIVAVTTTRTRWRCHLSHCE